MHIITNNQYRQILNSFDLPAEVLSEFDYYNEEQLSQALFFKYKGQYYDLAQFQKVKHSGLENWHGLFSLSYFSGILVKLANDGESVLVGRYH